MKRKEREIAFLSRSLSEAIHRGAKILLNEWSYGFYDTALPTELQQRHVTNLSYKRILIKYIKD